MGAKEDRKQQADAFWSAIVYMFGATIAGLMLYKAYPEIKFLSKIIFG